MAIMNKSLVHRLFARFGLAVRRIPESRDGSHTRILPHATYSPWNGDREFQRTMHAIDGFTLVDEYRCYELWKLVEQAAKLDRGALIEIGVWRGGTGVLIARQAERCGIREPVYLCDTFTGIVKAGVHDPHYRGGEHGDTSVEVVAGLMKEVGAGNARLLQGIFPEQTGQAVEKETFRFCHIDVDVYEAARDILEWIWERMVPGGIVVYDDFGLYTTSGIARHVEEQMLLKDRFVLYNLNGHAVLIKR